MTRNFLLRGAQARWRPELSCSVRPKSVDRRGIENEGYLMGSLIQSSKVDLHRPPQRMRDHSGRRALVVEPDSELDGRCNGGQDGIRV